MRKFIHYKNIIIWNLPYLRIRIVLKHNEQLFSRKEIVDVDRDHLLKEISHYNNYIEDLYDFDSDASATEIQIKMSENEFYLIIFQDISPMTNCTDDW
jgi:hypothetical protein